MNKKLLVGVVLACLPLCYHNRDNPRASNYQDKYEGCSCSITQTKEGKPNELSDLLKESYTNEKVNIK